MDNVPTSTGEIIVFTNLSEEAEYSGSTACTESTLADLSWTWGAPVCQITDFTVAYDTGLGANVVTVTGTGFTISDLNSITLFVDGIE